MLAVALHLRTQGLSLRDIAARLVISTGKKKGQHPSPATVMRMLRDHDEALDSRSYGEPQSSPGRWLVSCPARNYHGCGVPGGNGRRLFEGDL